MSDIAFASHFFNEPCWQEAPKLRWQLDTCQRDWLLDKGSLTARLLARSGGQLTVTILRQQWLTPYLSETRLLGTPLRQRALVREVILSGAEVPWVFARSILPLSTLTGRLRRLRTLDNRPLGGLLFKDPSMHRGNIEIARIKKEHRYLPLSMASDRPLWGRRSRFYLDGKPLLVSEVFLDTFTP